MITLKQVNKFVVKQKAEENWQLVESLIHKIYVDSTVIAIKRGSRVKIKIWEE